MMKFDDTIIAKVTAEDCDFCKVYDALAKMLREIEELPEFGSDIHDGPLQRIYMDIDDALALYEHDHE